jgi:hypothetical protein
MDSVKIQHGTVTERGYSVAEASERLGISDQSL